MSSIKNSLNDCFIHDKDRLKHDEAISILKSRVNPICEVESLGLRQLVRRVLAEDIISTHNIPLTNNAAVDGYAFRFKDLEKTDGKFPIVARIVAGDINIPALSPNSAIRIFTGAVIPEGADSVAMQEDCEIKNDSQVNIPKTLKQGVNLRLAGEDVKSNTKVATIGQILRPQDLAAIASTGVSSVKVYSKLRVGIISTGNEIIRPESTIQPGQIYDSNTFLIDSLLHSLPVEITDLGNLRDNFDSIKNTLENNVSQLDVIISSGGASRGDEDYLNAAIDALGSRHLWQLAIKPGRPMSFGQIENCAILALPGNPVAVMVCFLLYVYPTLLRLAGTPWFTPNRFPLPASFSIENKKNDRREFLRGKLIQDSSGQLCVEKFPRDGSGLITGLCESDGLIELDENVTTVKPGEMVSFIPFQNLV